MEEAWADIAVVFHWPLADLERLGFLETMQWRDRAAKRNGSEE
ncbi:MAG: GpE family phage tail protein [Zoogloeaceae bacterium]|jgi:hypothetical protein|nr:GpE family phage tail protein [Zoogloeaceae bacterium]